MWVQKGEGVDKDEDDACMVPCALASKVQGVITCGLAGRVHALASQITLHENILEQQNSHERNREGCWTGADRSEVVDLQARSC